MAIGSTTNILTIGPHVVQQRPSIIPSFYGKHDSYGRAHNVFFAQARVWRTPKKSVEIQRKLFLSYLYSSHNLFLFRISFVPSSPSVLSYHFPYSFMRSFCRHLIILSFLVFIYSFCNFFCFCTSSHIYFISLMHLSKYSKIWLTNDW